MSTNDRVLHLMLAEDDADEREFFQDALASLGRNLQLDIFNNGRELLDGLIGCRSESRCPDIIFLDLNMPRLSGMEALEEIRRTEDFSCVPVVAILTTSNAEQDRMLTFEKGADAFISKPSSYKELTLLIKKILDTDWEIRKRNFKNFTISLQE